MPKALSNEEQNLQSSAGGALPIRMTRYRFGNETFAVFDKFQRGGVWMLQFIWGKKDFRIYLGRHSDYGDSNNKIQGPILISNKKQEKISLTRLQYLNAFLWYDYLRVIGHGLIYEEILWARGQEQRCVELPRDFKAIALELVCMEFRLHLVENEAQAT